MTGFDLALPFYESDLPCATYFAITEDPAHTPNTNTIGFWAEKPYDVGVFVRWSARVVAKS